MPKKDDFLAPLSKTLDGLGYKVELRCGEDDRDRLLAESEMLRVIGGYTGKEYVVIVSALGEDDWMDLRDVLAYIKEGSARFSKKPRHIYLGPAEYAREIQSYHGCIRELIADPVKRQRLRKEIKGAVDKFVRSLYERAAKRRFS